MLTIYQSLSRTSCLQCSSSHHHEPPHNGAAELRPFLLRGFEDAGMLSARAGGPGISFRFQQQTIKISSDRSHVVYENSQQVLQRGGKQLARRIVGRGWGLLFIRCIEAKWLCLYYMQICLEMEASLYCCCPRKWVIKADFLWFQDWVVYLFVFRSQFGIFIHALPCS